MEPRFYFAKRTKTGPWELVEYRRDGRIYTMGWDIADEVRDFIKLVPANILDPDGKPLE